MKEWLAVRSTYGDEYVLYIPNLQGYRRVNDIEYMHYCGIDAILVNQETHDRIMYAIDEYCEEFEKLVGKNEGSNCGSKEVVVQNTNGLDSRDIRYKILNADFLDAEQKLKLIVSLNI